MNRKLFGLIVAIGLAAAGTFVLVSYVRNAEQRALADEERVEVLVVDDPVATGESAETLAGRIKPELVPAKVRADGAVASIDQLEGMVAAVDLVPGEQLLASRFITQDDFAALGAVQVPEGLLEVTISLAPHRAIGGQIVPGDTVAFVASFDPFTVEDGLGESPEFAAQEPTGEEGAGSQNTRTSNSTHIILHKLLVTNVQVERLPSNTDAESAQESGLDLAPTGNLLITLAADAPQVEKIVFTAEHGSVWLARQSETASEEGTQIQTRGTIYR